MSREPVQSQLFGEAAPAGRLIAEVAVDCPGRDSYSWLVPEALAAELAPGDCVLVPFHGRRERGFVLALARRVPDPGIRYKELLSRRAGVRLPAHLLRLIAWGAGYYRCSMGEFLAGAVPSPVREGVKLDPELVVVPVPGFAGKLTPKQAHALSGLPPEGMRLAEAVRLSGSTREVFRRLAAAGAAVIRASGMVREVRLEARTERHRLTGEQQAAVAAVAACLEAGRHQAFLLYGVTGSGKTLVYLELAERVIASGRQVLFLLPEISLTPQLAARIRTRFDRVAVWHSAFTQGERAESWRQVAEGGIDLVVGTRSALFAPLPAPGLIVVDEEHEHSYKQESVPRYHARDLAVVYARQLGIPVVLGSATPSLESIHNARGQEARYQVLSLRQRPLGGSLPEPLLVDMRAECRDRRQAAVLSRALVERLAAALRQGEQSIVLLNRRGWSPVVSCRSCGSAVGCAACDISLTWHKAAGILKCHYCGAQRAMPKTCPTCGEAGLGTFGLGTEQLAALLGEAVPGLRVLRADADTVGRRQGHAELFKTFAEGGADCLVGTQMVAKGLDFPRVTVVGVLCADRGLAMPDFRAAERTWQLVAQVAGRAGRGERPGQVVVQSFDTEALALRCALENRPKTFVDAELALRRKYGYPPYTGLVRFQWSAPSAAQVQLAAVEDGQRLQSLLQGEVLLGPNPAAVAFIKGQHRWHALLKAASRGAAQAFLDRLAAAGGLQRAKDVATAVDVDPMVTG